MDSFPLIQVLGLSGEDIEAFQNVDDVVNAPPFDIKLLCTFIKSNDSLVEMTVEIEEPLAKIAQALVLPAVLPFLLRF